jgi:DMSO reductase anchor subunit
VAHRLAVVTAAATVVLIVFGGLVTNTGSAPAVPDWPTTFGHDMFLYPWSEMAGGVFFALLVVIACLTSARARMPAPTLAVRAAVAATPSTWPATAPPLAVRGTR